MEEIVRPLLDWYKKAARELPWRQNIDPYRVWVSEIMLQQTRIEAARGYYERFMAALPTVEALAAADGETVMKLWEGLGYYSRARNLHACAKKLTAEYGGAFPDDVSELRRLPGIGDYTAGAIASIAFGKPAPAVDGNVLRLLSRLERSPRSIGDERVRAEYRRRLQAVYPPGECGAFTSALMELGEVVCVPGTPNCEVCPLAALCAAHQAGDQTAYPVMPGKKPRRVEHRRVLLLLCRDKCALRKRPEKGLLAGLWELPNDTDTGVPPGGEPCGEAVHIFSHVEWHMTGYILRCTEELPGYTWVTAGERAALAIPSAFRYYTNILKEAGH